MRDPHRRGWRRPRFNQSCNLTAAARAREHAPSVESTPAPERSRRTTSERGAVDARAHRNAHTRPIQHATAPHRSIDLCRCSAIVGRSPPSLAPSATPRAQQTPSRQPHALHAVSPLRRTRLGCSGRAQRCRHHGSCVAKPARVATRPTARSLTTLAARARAPGGWVLAPSLSRLVRRPIGELAVVELDARRLGGRP